jgi:C4-dicarboxylate-specific signal transduction histidine kinase
MAESFEEIEKAVYHVIDWGAGIVPSTLEHLFHPLTGRGAAGKRMGLGLAISHAIVASHAGTLTVTSARFSFHQAAARQSAVAPPARLGPSPRRLELANEILG